LPIELDGDSFVGERGDASGIAKRSDRQQGVAAEAREYVCA
jgi:hypothetical protein